MFWPKQLVTNLGLARSLVPSPGAFSGTRLSFK